VLRLGLLPGLSVLALAHNSVDAYSAQALLEARPDLKLEL
jgi:hypothetical protein